jgi:hypothetical protein
MAQMNLKPVQQPPLLRVEPFKGMNLSVTPTQIDQSQSPDMLNVNIDERGALNKRTGYERIYTNSLGPGAINGLYEYKQKSGAVFFLIAHTTKLYVQANDEAPVEIYDGLSDNRIDFFTMNDKCYLLDGTNFLVYDGSSVQPITPYIPTIAISKQPSGGGTGYEDFNLLGAGFKDSFSGDGTSKDFILSLKELDATTVKADVDGTTITEGSGLTVDRTAGKVTFTTAPSTGTNNVVVTAYKTQSGFADRIIKCRFHVIFGGSNDTRVFVSGNQDMPDYMWRSGLYDPTYFPENGFYKFPENVKGFAKQYDYLVVERENGKHQVTFELVNGEASFPSKPINDQVGTLATQSIQIIENNPVSLSRNGVYMLASSNVRDERNVSHISSAIDLKLLKENGLENAVSVEFDKKYWLALNGNVYIFDYVIGEWYVYDNIKANAFITMGKDLYFGSYEEGLVYRFRKDSELKPYNDDGNPIKSVWKSKYFTFGADERRKMIDKVFYSLKPMNRASCDVYYRTEKKESGLVKTTRVDLLDFRDVDFNFFSFLFTTFPQEKSIKIKAKKITHFQVVLENDKINEGMGVLSLGIKFRYQSEVK